MTTKTIGVHGVDKETFLEFKAMTVGRGIKIGHALTSAMVRQLEKWGHTDKKNERLHFLEVKPRRKPKK